MAQQYGFLPPARRQRFLQPLSFAEGSVLSRDLPKDTILISMMLRLTGSVVTTYASGTPVAAAESAFDTLTPNIKVTIGGGRLVKSVRPHLMQIQQLLTTTVDAERSYSAAAAASAYPVTASGGFVYGTTTQVTSGRECVIISFEHVYSDINRGRYETLLNLKGVSSAVLELTTTSFLSGLLGFGNTAPVTYSASTFQYEISLIEAQDLDANVSFSDFKQSTKDIQYSAQVTDNLVDINRGNFLSGIMLFARDGAAGSATTATGKLANTRVISDVTLYLNGSFIVQKIGNGLPTLNSQNRVEFGVVAPFASSVSRLDGIGYVNLLKSKDIRSALDVRPPAVDNVQLSLSTSSATSYTNPATVTIMTDEIVPPR
jgi:hypothetical protein